jgi:hypothetical protein
MMMMMRTGRILQGRAVEEAVLVMAMTITTERLRRTRRAVRKEPRKGRVQRIGMGNGKGNATEEGKGKTHSKGKGIVKQTPGGDDISHAVTSQLQKEMYEADSDTEG